MAIAGSTCAQTSVDNANVKYFDGKSEEEICSLLKSLWEKKNGYDERLKGCRWGHVDYDDGRVTAFIIISPLGAS